MFNSCSYAVESLRESIAGHALNIIRAANSLYPLLNSRTTATNIVIRRHTILNVALIGPPAET